MDKKKETFNADYKNLIEESAEDLYENAPCGYLSFLPDGTIVKINNTIVKWIGLEKSEILYKKKFQDLLSIGGRIFFETHIATLLRIQNFVNEISFDLVKKDKILLPVLANAVAVKDQEGITLLYRTTLFNITDRKKYEVELLNARKKAEEASRAKAEFLSTISHEIRTPMNAIIGVANLLLEDDHSPKQDQYLKILKNSSDNLLNLINDILDFSKIDSGKLTVEEKNFSISDLINSVLFSLGVKAEEKGLELKVSIDEKLPEFLKGDPVRLTQILTNLIGNAIKFTEKGHVRLVVNLLAVSNNKASVYFEVEDTGRGISKDKLSKIFEEFTQENYEINLKYGGTGLGLTISQKLLQMFGSKIELESEPGKGAKFFFKLSLDIGEKSQDSGTYFIKGESRKLLEGISLLLVEDNSINVFIISQYFNNWGIEFDVAENGEKAIEMVKCKDYDIVLMDLQMPVMNGYTASGKIRELSEEKYLKLPIIALTASARSDIKERITHSKINDYISKPFNPKDLYNMISFYTKRTGKIGNPDLEQETELSATVETNINKDEDIVDLSYFTQITKNNPSKIPKLIEATIEGFESYKLAFIKALQERDKTLFDQIEHKSKMVMGVLKAKRLQSKIVELSLLYDGTINGENVRAINQTEFEMEIDKVIEKLNAGLVQSI